MAEATAREAPGARGALRAERRPFALVMNDGVTPGVPELEPPAALSPIRSRVPIARTSPLRSLVLRDDREDVAPARLAPKPRSHRKLAEPARRTLEEAAHR